MAKSLKQRAMESLKFDDELALTNEVEGVISARMIAIALEDISNVLCDGTIQVAKYEV